MEIMIVPRYQITKFRRKKQETGISYHKFLIENHFTDDGMNGSDLKFEHVGKGHHADGVVHLAVREQISPQRLLLNLLADQFTNSVCLVKQVPHLRKKIVDKRYEAKDLKTALPWHSFSR